jgi:hypothetical protein
MFRRKMALRKIDDLPISSLLLLLLFGWIIDGLLLADANEDTEITQKPPPCPR